MLVPLDDILFPNDCKVVHMPLCDQWVFHIQKNGTSTLRKEQIRNDYRLYINEEIGQLEFVDVYVRDAKSRYVSGVNTFLEFLHKDHPDLDMDTAFWFAKTYKFLNRHFLPQFFWVLNLSRYLNPTAHLRFHDFESINKITNLHDVTTRWTIEPDFQQRLLDDHDMELWFFLDQILRDLSGQELTWQQLKDHYRQRHPEIWQLITNKFSGIAYNVLS